MRLNELALVCGLLILLGAGCKPIDSILAVELNHVSDAALVTCNPYPAKGGEVLTHTCLVLTNPFAHLARVFDTTDLQYVLAPLAFDPLAVRIDGLPAKLASFENSTKALVFVLDVDGHRVLALDAKNGPANEPSFATLKPPPSYPLDKRPVKALAVPVTGNSLQVDLLIALEDASLLRLRIDLETLQTVSSTSVGPVGSLDYIEDLQVDPSNSYVVLSGQSLTQSIYSAPLSTLVFQALTSETGDAKIALGSYDYGQGIQTVLFVGKPVESKIKLFSLAAQGDSATLLAEGASTLRTARIYFPSGDKLPCCGGEANWVAIGSDDGEIAYIKLATFQTGATPDKYEAKFQVATVANAPRSSVSGLSQLLGGDVVNHTKRDDDRLPIDCTRQMFLVYASGFVGSICEGASTRIARYDR